MITKLTRQDWDFIKNYLDNASETELHGMWEACKNQPKAVATYIKQRLFPLASKEVCVAVQAFCFNYCNKKFLTK